MYGESPRQERQEHSNRAKISALRAWQNTKNSPSKNCCPPWLFSTKTSQAKHTLTLGKYELSLRTYATSYSNAQATHVSRRLPANLESLAIALLAGTRAHPWLTPLRASLYACSGAQVRLLSRLAEA